MSSDGVLRRLLRLGMLSGSMGLALLGSVGRPGWRRMRLMPGDVRMSDLASAY